MSLEIKNKLLLVHHWVFVREASIKNLQSLGTDKALMNYVG